MDGAEHFLAQFFSSYCSYPLAWLSITSFPNKVMCHSAKPFLFASSIWEAKTPGVIVHQPPKLLRLMLQVRTLLSIAGEEVPSATWSPSVSSPPPPHPQPSATPPTPPTPSTTPAATFSPTQATRWLTPSPIGHNLCSEVWREHFTSLSTRTQSSSPRASTS